MRTNVPICSASSLTRRSGQSRRDPGLALREAKLLDDPGTRKLFTFEYKSGRLESIRFETGADNRPDAGKLTAIYIDYREPIDVSLRRLESYLGASSERNKKIAAQVESPPVAAFTNLQPGQKERERSSYSFFPDQPIAPGHLKYKACRAVSSRFGPGFRRLCIFSSQGR